MGTGGGGGGGWVVGQECSSSHLGVNNIFILP